MRIRRGLKALLSESASCARASGSRLAASSRARVCSIACATAGGRVPARIRVLNSASEKDEAGMYSGPIRAPGRMKDDSEIEG